MRNNPDRFYSMNFSTFTVNFVDRVGVLIFSPYHSSLKHFLTILKSFSFFFSQFFFRIRLLLLLLLSFDLTTFIYSFISIHSSIHSCMYLIFFLLIHSFIYLFIYLFISWKNQNIIIFCLFTSNQINAVSLSVPPTLFF